MKESKKHPKAWAFCQISKHFSGIPGIFREISKNFSRNFAKISNHITLSPVFEDKSIKFSVCCVTERLHAAKMAKDAKNGMKFSDIKNGKARKQYSVAESERFDEYTGLQEESDWYKIDRETEPWSLWDGLKEMNYLQWLQNQNEEATINKIKQKIRMKWESKRNRKLQRNKVENQDKMEL